MVAKKIETMKDNKKEKDLGVTINADMKVSEQCCIALQRIIIFLDWLGEI